MNGPDLMAALISKTKMSENEVAKAAKGSQPQLNRFVSGKVKEPRRDTLEPFAAYFKVELDAFYKPPLAAKIAKERGLTVPPRPARKKRSAAPGPAATLRFPPTSKEEWELLSNYRTIGPTYKRLLLKMSRTYLEETTPPSKQAV